MADLPIESVLGELRAALRAGTSAVLQAPPGAGKTTRVPLALLDEPWLGGGRIVMLEPRRLAARAAAARMAETLGERVGETVGHRVRMDTRVGRRTRIEVVTEGVLTRLLHDDPALEGTGLVIFDEFHERSLVGDLGLALTLQTRSVLREELRVLVMSATLDGATVAALLGGAPLVTSEGREFPVETRHRARRDGVRTEAAVAGAVRAALREARGSVLAFLPGAGEIRRAQEMLEGDGVPPDVDVVALYGNLSQEMQDRAIRASPPGRRKVVLATSIAETSLTIDGIGIVVDSGLARVPRFSPRTGMTRLETVRVSRASADQRRGRAGRLGPGVCYRLWEEHEHHALLAQPTPEILEADLAPLALDLAAAGVVDPAELRWLDPPPAASFSQARELLAELGALDERGRITAHGRGMASFGMHPRLAHMLLRGRELGLGALACDVAALLTERDILRGDAGPPDADLRLRLELMRGAGDAPGFAHEHRVDRDGLRRAKEQAGQWRSQLGVAPSATDAEMSGVLVALAYPDRIARRRAGQGGRFLLRSGGGAVLAGAQALGASEYLAVAEVDGQRPESRIYLAAPLDEAAIEEHFAAQIERERVVEWDAASRQVLARRRERLGGIVLRDAPLRDADPSEIEAALLEAMVGEGIGALSWTDGARRLRQRMSFARRLDPTWPDVSDDALAATMRNWLAPHLHGLRKLDEVARLDVHEILLGMLDWRQRATLDEIAPTHLVVPSGSRIPIDYADSAAPVLAVRLQEMFGLAETPTVGRGAVPLTIHLLSPASRPVQVTRDLAGFWRTTYFEVRKDLKGRYPKHHWPDDPMVAEPTRRAKPRGS